MAAYERGVKTGDSSIMKPAFHEKATMYGFDANNELISEGPIENLYKLIDAAGAEPDYEFDTQIMSRTENTASVRVDIYLRKQKVHMVDYHNLIHIDDNWQIISKIYQIL